MNLKIGALLLLVGSMGLLAACGDIKKEPDRSRGLHVRAWYLS